jgi:hypothetical protein
MMGRRSHAHLTYVSISVIDDLEKEITVVLKIASFVDTGITIMIVQNISVPSDIDGGERLIITNN